MSDSESFAIVKASPRGFARTLFLGAMIAGAALVMQAAELGRRHDIVRRPALARLIPKPVPVMPSAFDVELTMTPGQLLNRWDTLVTEASKRFHVPKPWIRAVMARESGGRTMLGEGQPIVSSAGAIGLMQVLPATYAEMRGEHHLGDNPFDARDNILAGTAYLRWLHAKYGYPAMFAAYNAGPGRLEDHIAHRTRLPAETRAYVGGITRVLNPRVAASDFDLVSLTQPDGGAVKIDARKVTAVRAATPGEYAPGVNAVVTLGKRSQGIRENAEVATAAIRATGGLI